MNDDQLRALCNGIHGNITVSIGVLALSVGAGIAFNIPGLMTCFGGLLLVVVGMRDVEPYSQRSNNTSKPETTG